MEKFLQQKYFIAKREACTDFIENVHPMDNLKVIFYLFYF
jgi:hypothetical protein